MKGWLARMAVLMVFFQAGAATAQVECSTDDRARAVRLAREAREAMRVKRYDDARRSLKEALSLCPLPEFLHAMGCVEEAAGETGSALEFFEDCEARAGDEGLKGECREKAKALQTRMRSPAPEQITVTPAPAPTPVEPRTPAPESMSSGPQAPAPRRDATWNWVGVGVSVALIGAGVGFLAKYGKDRSDAHGAEYYPDGSLKREADRVQPTNAVVGGVCAGLGVAGLVTSVLSWPTGAAGVGVGPAPGGAAVSFAATW